MTDAEKDARIAALEQQIKDITEALTFAPDSAYWSRKLSELLGTSDPVNHMHRRLREEYDRGRCGAISNMIAVLNGLNGGAP